MKLHEVLRIEHTRKTSQDNVSVVHINNLLRIVGAETKDQVIELIKNGTIRHRASGVHVNGERFGTSRTWDILMDWLGVTATFPNDKQSGIPIIQQRTPNSIDATVPSRRNVNTESQLAKWRSVLYKHEVEGKSFKEIAKEFGVTPSSISAMYSRAWVHRNRSANQQ